MSFTFFLISFLVLLGILFLVAAILLLVPKRDYLPLGLAVSTPMVALMLYIFLGQPAAYIDYQQTRAAIKAAIKEQGATQVLQESLAQLEAELAQQPTNDELRLNLARAYLTFGQLDRAIEIMSHPFKDDNSLVLALRLQLHYRKSGWDEEVGELANQLARLDSQHPTLLSLRAVEAFKQQDYEEAIGFWRLLLTTDISAVEEQEVLRLIKEAQQAMQL